MKESETIGRKPVDEHLINAQWRWKKKSLCCAETGRLINVQKLQISSAVSLFSRMCIVYACVSVHICGRLNQLMDTL